MSHDLKNAKQKINDLIELFKEFDLKNEKIIKKIDFNDPEIFENCQVLDEKSEVGTIAEIINYLTKTTNTNFLIQFLLTFRLFISAYDLTDLLITKYKSTVVDNTEDNSLIRLR